LRRPRRVFDGDVGGGADAPALGSDFDEFAVGVGEVEEEAGGDVGIVDEADAAADEDVGIVEVGGEGAGLEEVEEGVPDVGGRVGIVLGPVAGDEPVAEGFGAEGEVVDAGVDEGAVVGGGVGEEAPGDAEAIFFGGIGHADLLSECPLEHAVGRVSDGGVWNCLKRLGRKS
jgi:hypothetical protein